MSRTPQQRQLSGFKESDDSEEVILEPRLIAVEYMKTWFFLDLLSSLPVDYIFLVLDSGLLDTHLVSRFKLSCLINGDQKSVEQARYATTSAVFYLSDTTFSP